MVVRIGPNSVRLGISAPKHLQITRSEPQASNQKEQSVEKVS